ncbi:MAG: uroporphyrinogen-III synthase [Oligoflexus sp.]
MNQVNLVWTRSLEDWTDDEQILAGSENLWHWPLIAHQAQEPTLPTWEPQLVLVTSQKAFHFARQSTKLGPLLRRKIPILVFGKQTWQHIRGQSFQAICLQAADGEGFVKKILACYPPSRAFYLSSQKPATPIDERLNQEAWQVSRVVVYKTQTPSDSTPPDGLLTAMQERPTVICFASPSAVQTFASWLQAHPGVDLQKVHAVAIGQTTAKACQSVAFANCELSLEADLAILWATAKRLADSL